jgi:hypothetical protein
MQSHVGLVKFPRFFGMHVEAVGAAVDLRGASRDGANEAGGKMVVVRS